MFNSISQLQLSQLSNVKSALVMTPVMMATIMLIIVLGSPVGNASAKKSSDSGINNPDRCFQAGKDDGRDSQFSQSEFDNVDHLMNTDL